MPLTITALSPNFFTIGTPYSGTITASGGTAPYTYSIVNGPLFGPSDTIYNKLPPWATLNNTTGVVTGTPTGNFNSDPPDNINLPPIFRFTAKVVDSAANTATVNCYLLTEGAAQWFIYQGRFGQYDTCLPTEQVITPGALFPTFTWTFQGDYVFVSIVFKGNKPSIQPLTVAYGQIVMVSSHTPGVGLDCDAYIQFGPLVVTPPGTDTLLFDDTLWSSRTDMLPPCPYLTPAQVNTLLNGTGSMEIMLYSSTTGSAFPPDLWSITSFQLNIVYSDLTTAVAYVSAASIIPDAVDPTNNFIIGNLVGNTSAVLTRGTAAALDPFGAILVVNQFTVITPRPNFPPPPNTMFIIQDNNYTVGNVDVDITGTIVTYVSGQMFTAGSLWVGAIININGGQYQIVNSPSPPTTTTLYLNPLFPVPGGPLTNVAYSVGTVYTQLQEDNFGGTPGITAALFYAVAPNTMLGLSITCFSTLLTTAAQWNAVSCQAIECYGVTGIATSGVVDNHGFSTPQPIGVNLTGPGPFNWDAVFTPRCPAGNTGEGVVVFGVMPTPILNNGYWGMQTNGMLLFVSDVDGTAATNWLGGFNNASWLPKPFINQPTALVNISSYPPASDVSFISGKQFIPGTSWTTPTSQQLLIDSQFNDVLNTPPYPTATLLHIFSAPHPSYTNGIFIPLQFIDPAYLIASYFIETGGIIPGPGTPGFSSGLVAQVLYQGIYQVWPTPLWPACPLEGITAVQGQPWSSNIWGASAYNNDSDLPWYGTGTPPYTFVITSGSLPPGLTLNPANGVISGTPTASGTYTFIIQVTDAVGVVELTTNVPTTGPFGLQNLQPQGSPISCTLTIGPPVPTVQYAFWTETDLVSAIHDASWTDEDLYCGAIA
jgi:Putative Ig domain